jgi:hypothetical protein
MDFGRSISQRHTDGNENICNISPKKEQKKQYIYGINIPLVSTRTSDSALFGEKLSRSNQLNAVSFHFSGFVSNVFPFF